MSWLNWGLIGVTSFLILGVLAIMVMASRAPRPEGLGVINGRLAACIGSGNCVSSEDGMAPAIQYESSREAARERLQNIILGMPRVTLLADEPDYLAVAFRSRFFGFIDDTEFQFSSDHRIIHFRSAARQGRSDFKVNRTRIESIRAAFRAGE